MTASPDIDRPPLAPGDVAVDIQKRRMLEEVRAYRLRELRESLNLTQVELAKLLDVSQNRVSRLEHGDIERTQVDTLRRYAEMCEELRLMRT